MSSLRLLRHAATTAAAAAATQRGVCARAGLSRGGCDAQSAALVVARRHLGFFSRKGSSGDDDEPTMTRLGGNRATDGAPSMATARTNAPDRSDTEKIIAALQQDNRALAERLTHLTAELEHTRQMVQQLAPLVDRASHASELKSLETTLGGGGGLFLVENSADLAKALTLPGARIVLKKNRLYVLDMFQPVAINHTKVSIIGNNAVIIGTFSVHDRATLDITDACVVAPGGDKPISRERFNAMSDAERDSFPFTKLEDAPLSSSEVRHIHPVISVTANSLVNATRCTLSNGRDGVYLGLNSRAYLASVQVVNCLRGVYEGVDCYAMLSGHCACIGNYYHLVLLGKEKATRARALMDSSAGSAPANGASATERVSCTFKDVAEPTEVCHVKIYAETPVRLRQARADVCLDQNPISDTYDACWKDGKPITLPEELRTANLSDPVY